MGPRRDGPIVVGMAHDDQQAGVVPTGHSGGGGGGLRTALAWVALVCVAGLMIGLHALSNAPAVPKPGEPVPAAQPERDAGVMLKLIGRYSIGVRELGKTSPLLKDQAVMSQLVGTLDGQATTPTEKLRAAMIAGELTGPDAARKAVDGVLADGALDEGLRKDGETLLAMNAEGVEKAAGAVSAEDAERLKKRHHWFAEVALSRGLPESDPVRVEIIKTGTRTVIVMISAVVIAGVAMLIGFVLATIGVIMLVSGSLCPAYARDAALAGTTAGQRAALLESLVLFILALLGLSAAAEGIQAVGGPDLKVWLLWLALAAAWWPRVWGMERSAWKTALGWHTGRGVLREIGAGIVGYLAGLPIVLVGLVTTLVLVAVTGSKPTHPAVEQASAGGGWWSSAQLMVLACLWAPVCEETFFRGAMFAHCRRWLHPLLSALVVAFVFAAIHPQGWAVVPALMSLAVSFALVREWRGSTIASMTGHAMQNGFVMTLNLLMLGG